MINEFICKKCGTVITKTNYPNLNDAFKAMTEHAKTNHGINNYLKEDWKNESVKKVKRTIICQK